jgi:hypothetical protein
MFGRTATVMAGLLLLGACTQLGGEPLPPADLSVAPEDLEFASVNAGYQRAFEQSYTEAPFANGALAVVAPDDLGEIATYRLVPCQGGLAICAGSDRGPAGQLRRTADWFVLTGLYGRTFWLSYGGDGYVERNGQYIPLAWNARPNGTSDGDAPALETPYPHGFGEVEDLDVPLTASEAVGLGSVAVLGAPPQPTGPGRPLDLDPAE